MKVTHFSRNFQELWTTWLKAAFFVYRNQNSIPSGLPKRPPMPYLAQHDDLIRYIHDAWHKVSNQSIFNDNKPIFLMRIYCHLSWHIDNRTRPTWNAYILPESARTTIDKFPTIRFGKMVVSCDKHRHSKYYMIHENVEPNEHLIFFAGDTELFKTIIIFLEDTNKSQTSLFHTQHTHSSVLH